MSDPDLLVEEVVQTRRDRRPLVIAAVIGIVTGVTLGMGMFLGALGAAKNGTRQPGHLALVFFVMPVVVSLAIGYAVYRWRRRRRA